MPASRQDAAPPRSPPRMDVRKEIRFALVLYGGSSLAIYINGVAQEFYHMVRATAPDATGRAALLSDDALTPPEREYRHLAQTLGVAGKSTGDPYDPDATIATRFVIDIISGTSAGGINGVYLAKALATGAPLQPLREMWLEEGDFATLLNDRASLDRLRGLPLEDPPESLLNSRRMYRRLLEALDRMQDRVSGPGVPLVDELDLFVTTTDLRGLPIVLRLADEPVTESRYRNVHHFRYNSASFGPPANDFTPDTHPILAFAARCTSSFPFAFEPMRLTDIDRVLASMRSALYPPSRGASAPDWQRYFPDYRPPAAGDGVPSIDPAVYDYRGRAFVDGGYLDNKPFDHAIGALTRRHGRAPASRKLLYVEPAPDHSEDAPATPDASPDARPDALYTTVRAFTIPRDQTIGDDLRRVLDRNRLIERAQLILRGLDVDPANDPRLREPPAVPDRSQFGAYDLRDMIRRFGVAYGGYQRLKVADLTDRLARVIVTLARFDDESDEALAVRYLTRAWRDATFAYYLDDAGDTAPRRTMNELLLRFDLTYRLRRLDFVLGKAAALHASDEALLAAFPKAPSPDAIRMALERVTEALNPVYVALRATEEALGSHEKQPVLDALVAPLGALLPSLWRQPAVTEQERFARRVDVAGRARAAPAEPNAVAAAVAQLGLTRGDLRAILRERTEEDRNRRARALVADRLDGFQLLADALGDRIAGATQPAAAICTRFFGEPGASPEIAPAESPEDMLVRVHLAALYWQYERYDLITYPMLYGTAVGDELNRVDIVRVSPEDATSIVDERKTGRHKLAGLALAHFGAFLDRNWRRNDMMWGRLDGGERLVSTLAAEFGLADDERRAAIERMHRAVASQMRDEDQVDVTAGLLARAVWDAADPAGAAGDDAERVRRETLRALLEPPPGRRSDPAVLATLLAAATPDARLAYLRTAGAADPSLDRAHTLRLGARATRVIGRLLEGVSDRYAVSAKPAAWVTRVGRLFWGLVEASIPGSVGSMLSDYWIFLLILLEIVLLVGGWLFASPQVERVALAALGATLVAYFAVLSMRDVIHSRARWPRVLLGTAAAIVLILAVVGAVELPNAWQALRARVTSAFTRPAGPAP